MSTQVKLEAKEEKKDGLCQCCAKRLDPRQNLGNVCSEWCHWMLWSRCREFKTASSQEDLPVKRCRHCVKGNGRLYMRDADTCLACSTACAADILDFDDWRRFRIETRNSIREYLKTYKGDLEGYCTLFYLDCDDIFDVRQWLDEYTTERAYKATASDRAETMLIQLLKSLRREIELFKDKVCPLHAAFMAVRSMKGGQRSLFAKYNSIGSKLPHIGAWIFALITIYKFCDACLGK